MKTYPPFWALLVLCGSLLALDLDQTVKVHAEKLALMQQFHQALVMRKPADTQTSWVKSMRDDLLRLAPGDPEAARLVADLKLAPGKGG